MDEAAKIAREDIESGTIEIDSVNTGDISKYFKYDNVASMTAASIPSGVKVNLPRYYSGGDLVEGLDYYVKTSAQASADGDTADGYINHTLANGNIAVVINNSSLNILQAGAKTESVDAAFDNLDNIQAALDYAKLVYIPEGTFQVTDRLTASAYQTITFAGWIKLMDGKGAGVPALLSCSAANITLINPLLDGNRDSTTDYGGSGQWAGLSNYGTGFNLTVIGGKIINSRHNAFQGGRDGLTIIGTEMDGSGEHLLYINGVDVGEASGELCDNVLLQALTLKNPCLETTHAEGHYLQVRNAGKVVIDGVLAEGAGSNPAEPTFALLCDSVEDMTLKNSTFKDLTHRTIWHGASLEPAGKILVSNCNFSQVVSPINSSLVFTDAIGVTATFEHCTFDGFFISQSATDDTEELIFNHCTFTNAGTESSFYINTTFNHCTYSTDGTPTRLLRVYDGTLKLHDFESDVDVAESLYQQGGRVVLQNFRLPNKTGSLAVDLQSTATGGADILKDLYLPLADNAASIRITAIHPRDVVIGGLYMPLGGITDAGTGTTTTYGNVNI
jgi:hypothetical protein